MTAEARNTEGAAINLARISAFRVGEIEIYPATRQVTKSGASKTVEPRVMQVLVALWQAKGAVVSRDDLIQRCWAGRIVGENAIQRAISRLRDLAHTLGADSFQLENVSRVGYRLIIGAAGQSSGAIDVPALDTAYSHNKPSLAVLPFANLSHDPEQDYFTEGMMEEIVTALGRIRSIFVIGSGSSRSFKDQQADASEAARRLGVRYILEGSVRRSGPKIRISVQLTDAVQGAQIWAEKFEGTLDDVFALQDRVALGIAGVIEPAVLAVESRRAARRP